MSDRARVAPGQSAAPAVTPGTGRRPTRADGVLALQRTAGNSAVRRLLRETATATPTPTPTARATAEERLRTRWGVGTIRTGTEADQLEEMRRMTPSDETAPTAIENWQSWDPDAQSDIFADILAGFDAMGTVLGGVPPVREMRFLATDYDNVGGTATARPGHAATYSGGLLNVFRRFERATWALPDSRSTDVVNSPLIAGTRSDSRRRIIIHELAHGVFERMGSPTSPSGEEGFFNAWSQAAGWRGGHIEQNGTTLTSANWNNNWPEQPVSEYSLSNSMEDFCESLMCYIERPQVLAARSPGRHGFIDSRVSRWRSHLRAPA